MTRFPGDSLEGIAERAAGKLTDHERGLIMDAAATIRTLQDRLEEAQNMYLGATNRGVKRHRWEQLPHAPGSAMCAVCFKQKTNPVHKGEFFHCEFCGCYTNAYLRACCEAGRDADRESGGTNV